MAGYNETKLNEIFAQLSALSHSKQIDINTSEYIEFDRAITQFGYTSETLMLSLMHPCDRMLRQCIWWSKPTPCDQLFRVSRTTEGFCCSFNFKSEVKLVEWNEFPTDSK